MWSDIPSWRAGPTDPLRFGHERIKASCQSVGSWAFSDAFDCILDKSSQMTYCLWEENSCRLEVYVVMGP